MQKRLKLEVPIDLGDIAMAKLKEAYARKREELVRYTLEDLGSRRTYLAKIPIQL